MKPQSAKVFLQSSELDWDSTNPPPAGEFAPHPLFQGGGGHTRLRERGWVSRNSDEGTYTVIYKYIVDETHPAVPLCGWELPDLFLQLPAFFSIFHCSLYLKLKWQSILLRRFSNYCFVKHSSITKSSKNKRDFSKVSLGSSANQQYCLYVKPLFKSFVKYNKKSCKQGRSYQKFRHDSW